MNEGDRNKQIRLFDFQQEKAMLLNVWKETSHMFRSLEANKSGCSTSRRTLYIHRGPIYRDCMHRGPMSRRLICRGPVYAGPIYIGASIYRGPVGISRKGEEGGETGRGEGGEGAEGDEERRRARRQRYIKVWSYVGGRAAKGT